MNQPILLIDDDSNVLFILNRWLTDAGFTNVSTANNKDEIDCSLQKQWALVITDVFMPEVDGLELCKTIKRTMPTASVLVMTGTVSIDVTLRALETKVDDFLPKPMSRENFLRIVKEHLSKEKNITLNKPKQRILAIGAHPDDVEIGCGGILLGHRDRGDEIYILTLSGGARGGQEETRIQESQTAAKILNATLVMENFTDTCISEGAQTIEAISKVIQQCNPEIVYTHSINDAHQDHRNCYLASVIASRGIAQLESYQSPSSTIQFKPSRFVDITSSMEEKLALIQCYQTQVKKCHYLNDSLIQSTAQYWGRFADYGMVEPLEVIRTK